MNHFNNNRLLNSYQNYQQNENVPQQFQNNALLYNNTMFRNNMSYNESQQSQQMQRMYMANMQRQKELQKIKQMEKFNEIENKYDKDKIRESVIKPQKVERKNNVNDIITNIRKDWGVQISNKNRGNRYGDIADQFKEKINKQKSNYWEKRTNKPYKNIITDKKYINPFLNKRKIKESELVVHKVTPLDKEGVDDEYEDLQDKLEKHDNELKVIYSTNKKAEHKKKFEYSHKYKYRVAYNPSDHDKLKKDKIEYYKREQKKAEAGKEKVDTIINSLIDDGMLDEDEIQKLQKVHHLQAKEPTKKVEPVEDLNEETSIKKGYSKDHESEAPQSNNRRVPNKTGGRLNIRPRAVETDKPTEKDGTKPRTTNARPNIVNRTNRPANTVVGTKQPRIKKSYSNNGVCGVSNRKKPNKTKTNAYGKIIVRNKKDDVIV